MKKIILILIILLAAFLRLNKLGDYPAFNADEAAIGYNAYSLLETGKDEHSNPWPIHFQSFNDYKPGLYVYLTMPFIKLFGLNVWSVRLPSALAGIASVYLLYLLVDLLFGKIINGQSLNIKKKLIINNQSLALLSAFLLAISPWHLHYSRGGWEVNTATFFIMLGMYFLLKSTNPYAQGAEKSPRTISVKYLILGICNMVFSMYTYHAARIIAPLLLGGLIVMFFKDIKANIKSLLIPVVVGILLLMPLLRDLSGGEIISRAAGVGLFADVGPIEKTNEQRMEHPGKLSVIMHNKATNYGLTYLKNWGAHYHGLFLFISGDVIQRNAVPETGQMYLFEIITVCLGLYIIFRNLTPAANHQSPVTSHLSMSTDHRSPVTYHRSPITDHFPLSSRLLLLVLFWLLIAPVPAALTFQSPHALRSQNMVIPLTIISAIGLAGVINLVNTQKRFLKYLLFFAGGLLVSWNVSRYLHMYYIHMSKEYPFSSQYGLKELTDYISLQKKEYKNIVVTNKYDQPYILFLFYTKYPPQRFQKEHTLTPRDKYGFSTVDSFSNYIFKSIDWDQDKLTYPDSLIVGADEEIPDETNITKKIFGSNNNLYFKVVSN